MLNLFIPCGGILVEGCCWYAFFNWMGCMDGEPQQVQTQPLPPPAPQPPNPFIHTGLPKNPHLLPAYN